MLDIPGIAYFNKNTWCGSYKQKRCRIAVVEDNFVVSIWEEPYSFEATPQADITNHSFEHSEHGLQELSAFLNEQLHQ